VPEEIAVTNPVDDIVATLAGEHVHVPPPREFVSWLWVPATPQMVSSPPIADGVGSTVSTVAEAQPGDIAYLMVAGPEARPVATPVAGSIETRSQLGPELTDHVPPAGVLANGRVVLPTHTFDAPPTIGLGGSTTLKVRVNV
jgi:hypothetical protein